MRTASRRNDRLFVNVWHEKMFVGPHPDSLPVDKPIQDRKCNDVDAVVLMVDIFWSNRGHLMTETSMTHSEKRRPIRADPATATHFETKEVAGWDYARIIRHCIKLADELKAQGLAEMSKLTPIITCASMVVGRSGREGCLESAATTITKPDDNDPVSGPTIYVTPPDWERLEICGKEERLCPACLNRKDTMIYRISSSQPY